MFDIDTFIHIDKNYATKREQMKTRLFHQFVAGPNSASVAIKIPYSSSIHTTKRKKKQIRCFYFIFHDPTITTTLFYIHNFSTFQVSEDMLFSNL